MSSNQSLTSQLYFVALKRRLESNPERAADLALNILGDYLEQGRLNAALHKENERLRARLERQQRGSVTDLNTSNSKIEQTPQLFPLGDE